MTTTDAAAEANPSWWSQTTRSGEADPKESGQEATESGSFGFFDLIDTINPLHHLPVIGNLYRELTGDQISDSARMAGGTLWGGPVGLIAALANSVTERETGRDMGGVAMAWLRGEETVDTARRDALLAELGAPGAVAADVADADAQPGLNIIVRPPTAIADAGTGPTQSSIGLPLAAQASVQTAAAQPAAGPAAPATAPATTAVAHTAAAGTAPPEFSGRSADRLDAFIRQANAIRQPMEVPTVASPRRAEGGAGETGDTDPRNRSTPSAVKLAADGDTDVARWMSRALDRYETMRMPERS